jgi:hypothetical protein
MQKKRILVICKNDDDEIYVKKITQSQCNHLYLIGQRFDKVLVEDDIQLNDEELLEILICQRQDKENFIEKL